MATDPEVPFPLNIDTIPDSVEHWQRLVSGLLHTARSAGLDEYDLRLSNIRQVRSLYTTNTQLSGSTLGPAELLLLRSIHSRTRSDHTSATAHLKRVGLIDDASYLRGLELLGLGKDLAPIDSIFRPALPSLEQSSKRLVANAAEEFAKEVPASPLPSTRASNSPVTPNLRGPIRLPSRSTPHPPAPKKLARRPQEKDYSRNAFPDLHEAIDAFASQNESSDQTSAAERLQNIRPDPSSLGIFFSAYKSLTAIRAVPPIQDDQSKETGVPFLSRLNQPKPPSIKTPEGSLGSQFSNVTGSRFDEMDLDDSPSYRPYIRTGGNDGKPGTSGQQTVGVDIRRRESFHLYHEDSDDDNNSGNENNLNDGDDDDDDRENRLSRDETMITVFATSFFNALFSFGSSQHLSHQMLPIRELFRCAPSGQSGSRKISGYFKAAVDAVVPTIVSPPPTSVVEVANFILTNKTSQGI